MPGKIHVSIKETPLNIQDAYDFVADPEHGGFNSFIGAVRNRNLGKDVLGVSYDVFDSLALKLMQELCEEVLEKWDEKLNIYLSHYKGRLGIGGISTIIAVTSPHRDESFKACRFIIEEVKHRLPIWKQEHYVGSDSEWVKGHALCAHG